ncbi:MAG: EVE domain-containing protein [Pirellulales bacterium]
MRYWLLKTEPESFSIRDLAAAPGRTTYWSGVRNYQARNTMRDDMRPGDGVLFYHSNADPAAVVGLATVVKPGYPDFTAWDPQDHHFDPAASPENPIWQMVDIRFEREFARPLSLDELRGVKGLETMELLRKGSRLSVQPVTADEYAIVVKLAETPAPPARETPKKKPTKTPAKNVSKKASASPPRKSAKPAAPKKPSAKKAIVKKSATKRAAP